MEDNTNILWDDYVLGGASGGIFSGILSGSVPLFLPTLLKQNWGFTSELLHVAGVIFMGVCGAFGGFLFREFLAPRMRKWFKPKYSTEDEAARRPDVTKPDTDKGPTEG